MDLTKGLQLDIRPALIQGWAYARNILLSKGFSSPSNEDGTSELEDLDHTCVGRIPTNKEVVIFQTTGSNMEIGRLTPDGTYTKVVDTTQYTLSTSEPVRGIYRYNNLGELEIAWVNGINDDSNAPMFLNLDTAADFLNLSGGEFSTPTTHKHKILMFPDRESPETALSLYSIGSVIKAQYFFAIQYVIDEGRNEYTNPSSIYGPVHPGSIKSRLDTPFATGDQNIFISGEEEGERTSYAVKLDFTGLDTRYQRFRLLVIKKQSGNTTASVATEFNITGSTQTVYYTGQKIEDISLEEILVPNFSCVKADDITEAAKRIALFNIKTEVNLNYQKYANYIKVLWTTKSGTFGASNRELNRNQSYMPNEVYAFYINLEFDDGTDSRAFFIPAHRSSGTGTGGEFIKKASTETYPNTDDWEYHSSAGLQGDLGGNNVTFHQFPDYDDLYTIGDDIDKVLGIEVEDVWIPAAWRDRVTGFKIGFAKRDANSIGTIAEGLCYGVNYDTTLSSMSPTPPAIETNQHADYGRFYSQDVLVNKPEIPSGAKIVNKYENSITNSTNVANTGSWGWTGILSKYDDPVDTDVVDIIDATYVPANSESTPVTANSNLHREEYLCIEGSGIADTADESIAKWFDNSVNLLRTGTTISTGKLSVSRIYVDHPSNIYEPFINQEVINMHYFQYINSAVQGDNDTGAFYNGDGNLCATWIQTTYDDYEDNSLWAFYNVQIRHYCLLHAFDRIIDNALATSWTALHNSVNLAWQEWNWNKVYNINDIKSYTIFDTYNDNLIDEYPYRVQLGTKWVNDVANNSWRTFAALDYHEVSANRGVGVSIHGTPTDLLIQHQHALFKTEIKDRVSSDQSAAYLRETDIFETTAREIVDINGGYVGGQSKWASMLTKVGYVTVDITQGKVFIYTDHEGVKELSNGACRNWLRTNLATDIDLDVNNPWEDDGVHVFYDETFNRLLITKKNSTSGFTLSYSFDYGSWVCFHDYQPNSYFNIREQSYYIESDKVHKMNVPTVKGKFSGTTYDSYIDVVFNQEFQAVEYLKNVLLKTEVVTSTGAKQYDQTATKIMIYNDNQCSGWVDLKDNRFITARNTIKGLFSINEFRDLVSDPNVNILDSDYQLNSSNINADKDWFNKGRFTGDHVIVRVLYENVDNNDFYLNGIEINKDIIR